jgi:hypothetical protein
MVGGCVSSTVTVKLQLAMLPAASVTEQLTVVVPFGKTDPDAGLHVGVPTPGQLSVAVGMKFTTAEHWPGSFPWVMFAGHVMTGFWVSLTVTVKLQLGPAVVVQFTVVVPTGKVDPEAGVHVTVPHIPVVVGSE